MCLVPTGEALLCLEELIERVSVVAVDLDLLELWELGAVGELAERVDALVGARCLLAKLIAGEVENLEALGMVFLIEFLQFLILRGETAFGGCVDDEQYLVGILAQGHFVTLSVFHTEFVNGSHCFLFLALSLLCFTILCFCILPF